MYDITIIGSGIVGATTALAIARETSLKIALIEAIPPAFSELKQYDHRVSAISLAARNIFQNLDCWEKIIAKRISPYTKMQVWDAESKGEIHFDCQELAEPWLGYIIEDSVMRASVFEMMKQYINIDFLCPVKIAALQEKSDGIELTTSDQQLITTKLLIGADGADSWVRKEAKIALTSWDYKHTAIVATVETELPHQATARQRFLPTGPLAFLPLKDPCHCSIVWSVVPDYAAYLLSLDENTFCKTLAVDFAYQLGNIKIVGERYHFPLHMRHVKNYVKPHLALVGDAAHTIHPLAGQGVNLGLLDAATLAEVIIDAYNKGREFASFATLRRYERWRKGDTLTMLAMVEGLKRLFGSDKSSLQKIRSVGLTAVNRLPFLKKLLANYALGKREDLPRLAGERL
jgi:2-octaprenylphenol hydroxylase